MDSTNVKPKSQPVGCIQEQPNAQSICLGGRWVNLSALSRSQGIDRSYLSRIFSGSRPNPTMDYIKKIAAGLGMGIEELLSALDERYELIRQRHTEAEIQYLTRVIEETESDIKSTQKGNPIIPHVPGTRITPTKVNKN